jgi:putative addiction module component (TIGR02574 family)
MISLRDDSPSTLHSTTEARFREDPNRPCTEPPGSDKVVCMGKTDILTELPRLSPDERREILDKIWELDGGDWLDRGELTDAERVLIEQRLAEHEANPNAAVPWDEVEARLRQRFNQ